MVQQAVAPEIPASLRLPLGLLVDLPWLPRVGPGTSLHLEVPIDYEALASAAFSQPEVLGIQRLLTLARRGVEFRVSWHASMARKMEAGASIYPLLAVLLMLNCAHHSIEGDPRALELSAIRKAVLRHRFARDLFSDSEIVVCTDNGDPLPLDIYSAQNLKLRSREDFVTLVVDALSAQMGDRLTATELYRHADGLGVIVAELFENTDMHGKLDLSGKPLGIDSLRGLVFKRIKVEVPILRPQQGQPKERIVDCFEVSVFDSGVGYYASYTRNDRQAKASVDDEWKVLHNCLERHYHPDLMDHRSGHRAMGLYEVLRTLQTLNGRIEIRTGQLFAYRTFMDGELQANMRPRAEYAYHAWPIPKLLDVGQKYKARPSAFEPLIGSSVRIIVPLN